jgi:protein-L-isoaspartate(D-aspartate) O-methyltransferase
MDPFAVARAQLVEVLRQQGIVDDRVLRAIGRVRRDAFVPPDLAERAYENVALPIGHGQTISQPYIVAEMTQALHLTACSRVLDVGTGSGYQAAILAEIAGGVVSVERVPELSAAAGAVLARLGYQRVELQVANGTLGWPPGAPYDAILAAAGGPAIPDALLTQLALGGRLVKPVGTLAEQQLTLVHRTERGFERYTLGPVRFVPLVGEGAWPEGASAQAAGTPPVDEPPPTDAA